MKVFAFFITLIVACYPAISQKINIIPEPVELKALENQTFRITSSTPVIATQASGELGSVARYLITKISETFRYDLKLASSGSNGITLMVDPTIGQALGSEGYLLDVSAEQVKITANTPAGIFYGIQTLLQLMPVGSKNQELIIPGVSIKDYPRFQWRGIMLDVSRHFFSKEYVKKYIDQLAQYKFNKFHWHLTDDNGWRIEIKSYPKLTQVGSWRVPRVGTFNSNEPPKPGEKPTDGGYYTQDDIKEIVRYARDRYIDILPEIDVPGHSMAAIAAYPELSVTKDTTTKVNPGSSFATWHSDGKFTMHIDNALNPTDENVYKFLDKVFGEVAMLFPFEYIHIGGDECYKGYWEKDSNVQAFMKKNKIKDGNALQGYFTKRVAAIVMNKKKKVIGWDEILESELPPGVDVMSWRGTKGGIEAAHQKRKVVMSPNPQYYLDMGQGEPSIEPPIYDHARLKTVYDHEVIPQGVDSTFILGGQGNLWTEQVPTTAQVEYMTYPRAFAMAESFWSPRARKRWDRFANKVETHFARLDSSGVNYSPAMYDPIISVSKKGTDIIIKLETEVKGLTVHYTYDNTVPDRYSPSYNGEPILFPEGADTFRVTTYRDGKPIGRLISIKTDELVKRIKK
jgi:hexosaminidase